MKYEQQKNFTLHRGIKATKPFFLIFVIRQEPYKQDITHFIHDINKAK